jgi:hypothetical protein
MKTIYDQAISFATSHGLHTEFPTERRRAKKKMPGEIAGDECLTGLARFKAETFIVVLDEAYQQMCSKFRQQNLTFMQQLSLFTPQTLLSDKSISSYEMICQLYEADANAVAAEMSDFKTTFKLLAQTSTATSIAGMFLGGCDDPFLGQGPSECDNEEEHVADESVLDIGDTTDFLPAGNDMTLNHAWQWQRHAVAF